jgi:hypothetical protein
MTTPPLQKWFLLAIYALEIIRASTNRVNAEKQGNVRIEGTFCLAKRMPMAKEKVTRRQKDISRLLREQKKIRKTKADRPGRKR